MMTIQRVIETGNCVLCDKEKEVAAVILDTNGAGEIHLCWNDVRKMAHMQMRMSGQPIATNRPSPPVAEVLEDTSTDES